MTTDPVACGVRHCPFAAEDHLQIEDFPVCGLHGGPLRQPVLWSLTRLMRPGAFLSSSQGGPIVCTVEQLAPEHLVPWAPRKAGRLKASEHEVIRSYLKRVYVFEQGGWQ